MTSLPRQIGFLWLLAMLLATPASLAVPPGPGGTPGFARSSAPPGEPVKVFVEKPAAPVAPGETVPVSVVLRMARFWHVNAPDPPRGEGYFAGAVPTTISASGPPGVLIGPAQWPGAHDVIMGLGTSAEQKVLCYENEVRILFPVVIPPVVIPPVVIPEGAVTGPIEIVFRIGYQACDHTRCMPPAAATRTVTLEVDRAAAPGAWRTDPRFAAFDTAFDAASAATRGAPDDPVAGAGAPNTRNEAEGGPPLRFSVFGALAFDLSPDGPTGPALLLLVAALGGFLLNLTPCVLPVIPLKIMSLARTAGSPRRTFTLGLCMGAGIVAFWLVLAAAIVGLAAFENINSLFQRPWFGIGVGAFILAMGLGMLGAFSVQLPQSVYRIETGHDSPLASVGFGVMTAVLSTPCTAPFMGTAAAYATQSSDDLAGKLRVLAVFAAIGGGMAVPYLVLARFPRLVERIPRTGPASALLKQVMGGLLIAVAFFFGGAGVQGLLAERPWLGAVLHWWLVAIAVMLTSLWLVYRTFRLTPSPVRRAAATAIGLALSIGIGAWTTTLTTIERAPKWDPFDPGAFELALRSQDVVLVEFTADW